jgi:hypothetical protein
MQAPIHGPRTVDLIAEVMVEVLGFFDRTLTGKAP